MRGYENGEYRIQMASPNLEWTLLDGSPVFSGDVDVQVTARKVSPAGGQAYALLFRATDINQLYRFAVSPDAKEYSLGKFSGSETNPRYDALVFWTSSSKINGGSAPNTLRVVCEGARIDLYVNGEFLRSHTDSSYLNGMVGMDAISFDSVSGVDARFDNLSVYRFGERPLD